MTEAQYKQRIGQLEASITDMETILDEREFQDYCDHLYSCISYFRQAITKVKKEQNEQTDTKSFEGENKTSN